MAEHHPALLSISPREAASRNKDVEPVYYSKAAGDIPSEPSTCESSYSCFVAYPFLLIDDLDRWESR